MNGVDGPETGRRALLCLCALLAWGSAVPGAEPPLLTDRPDQSDAPFVVPRGLFQIEGGVTHGERDQAGEKLATTVFPSTLLRYGLTETLELRLALTGVAVETTDPSTGKSRNRGLADAGLGLKFRITEQKGAIPHTAFVGTLVVPSGDDEFSSDRVDPAFRFAFGNSLTETVSLTYNVGMFWLTERDPANERDTRSFVEWSVTAGFAAGSRLGVFGELYGLTGASIGSRPLNSAGAGATYLLTPRLQVDGRVTVGLTSAALDWTAGAGVSYRFPRSEE